MGYPELSFQASWFKFSSHFVVNLFEVVVNLFEVALFEVAKITVMIVKVESKKSNSYKMVRSYPVSIWREHIT